MVEDVLTLGLSAKLMRYLRTRILGDVNVSQKDACFLAESKHSTTPLRGREESRGRPRQTLDASLLDGLRPGDEGLLGEQGDHERNISIRQAHGGEAWGDGGELMKSELKDSSVDIGMYEMIEEDVDLPCDGRNNKDLIVGRSKYGERPVGGRSTRDENTDENVRDESSRRKVNRCWSRSRGKGIRTEGTLENERTLTSSSGLRLGGMSRGYRDKSQLRNEDIKTAPETKSNSDRTEYDGCTTEENRDDRFIGCTIGSSDISEIVKEATRAAETEARTANAPEEAIKAAGDAAAELVKSAALEVSSD